MMLGGIALKENFQRMIPNSERLSTTAESLNKGHVHFVSRGVVHFIIIVLALYEVGIWDCKNVIVSSAFY